MTSIPLSEFDGVAGASAKFADLGDTHAGRITAAVHAQQREFGTMKPETWPDGSPKMEWQITLATAAGDNVVLYARGGSFQPDVNPATGELYAGESMRSAISTAVREAGCDAIDVGAELAVAFTGYAKAETGKHPAKLFRAQYRPAVAKSIPVDLFK